MIDVIQQQKKENIFSVMTRLIYKRIEIKISNIEDAHMKKKIFLVFY